MPALLIGLPNVASAIIELWQVLADLDEQLDKAYYTESAINDLSALIKTVSVALFPRA